MDKLKSILNPGSKSDDNKMYGSEDNSGKTGGQGTHFSGSRADHPSGTSEGIAPSGGSSNLMSDNASTTALKEGVAGPYSGTSGTSDNPALRAAHLASGTSPSTKGTSSLPISAEMTGQKYDSSSRASPYSSQGVDSRVDGPQAHSTKDTVIGGGGVSTAAAAFDKSNRGPEHESVTTGKDN